MERARENEINKSSAKSGLKMGQISRVLKERARLWWIGSWYDNKNINNNERKEQNNNDNDKSEKGNILWMA